MELDILGSAESLTPTVSRLPKGKLSVRSGTSQIDTVILADQVLELRVRGQTDPRAKKRKATDACSRPEDLGRTARLADDIRCYVVTRAERYAVPRGPSVTPSRHAGRALRRHARGM